MSLDTEKIPNATIISIKCKGCLKDFRSNTILKHLTKSITKKCIECYNDEDIASLKANSIELSKAKAEIWQTKNKEQIKQRKANWYKENQDDVRMKQFQYNQKDKVQAKRSQKRKEMYQANIVKKITNSNLKGDEKIVEKSSKKIKEPLIINAQDAIFCKGCNVCFEINTILKHLGQIANKECKEQYSKKEFKKLKKKSIRFTKEKAKLRSKKAEKIKYNKNRDKILQKKKEYYIQNKEKIKIYKKEKYAKDREEYKAIEKMIMEDEFRDWEIREVSRRKKDDPKNFLIHFNINKEHLEKWLLKFDRFKKGGEDVQDSHKKFLKDINEWYDFHNNALNRTILEVKDVHQDFTIIAKKFETLTDSMYSRAEEIKRDLVNSLKEISIVIGIEVECCSGLTPDEKKWCKYCSTSFFKLKKKDIRKKKKNISNLSHY